MRCRAAVSCPAVRCCAVLCSAALSLEHTVPGIMRSTRYRYVRACTHIVDFFIDCPPSQSSSLFFLQPYCRSERSITNKHTAQHRQSNQLCTCSSWQYQIASCTKSWASSFCPLHIELESSLRERSGQRQPPAERSPCTSYIHPSP